MPGYFGTDADRMWNPDMASATRDYERYAAEGGGGGWLSRLLGGSGASPGGRITSAQLPPPQGYEAPPPQPYVPPSPPATKLTSAPGIAERVLRMLAPPQEPPPVTSADFTGGVPFDPASMPMPPTSADFTGGIPFDPGQFAPPVGADDFGLRIPPRQGQAPAVMSAPSAWRSWFGGPQRRAMGGPIDMQRGGYPPLRTAPVRQGFFATGGGSNYVEPDGYGDGRSDHVEARLSPNEYVFDSESVSLLGNGDGEAGARKLDEMRKNLRKHKGRALSKGEFSPNAKKDAMEYLTSSPQSDGIRRLGRERE